MILRPVLAPLPPGLMGRDAVEQGRRAGRLCLELAAREAGVRGNGFPKDADGAPLPIGGHPTHPTHHWSVTNTAGLSAAVIAKAPVGIDAESLDRPRVAPLDAFADAEETAALGSGDVEARLRLWTAKEAVLKKTRVGIADLRACRLVQADDVFVLDLHDRRHVVLHTSHGRHVVAVACDEEPFTVEPLVLEAEAAR